MFAKGESPYEEGFKTMKLAILTFHRARNCGALLQSWALKTTLERMGHRVEFPDRVGVKILPRFIPFVRKPTLVRQILSILYRSFLNLASIVYTDVIRHRYLKFFKQLPCVFCAAKDFKGRYDAIVVGSDQVWNEHITASQTAFFLGEGIDPGVPLIAYAASLGDRVPSATYCEALKAAFPRFKRISLREEAGTACIRALGRPDATTVLDPTLLLTVQDYAVLKAPVRMKRAGIFTYAVSFTDESLARIHAIAKALHLPCRISRPYEKTLVGIPKGVSAPVDPSRLIAYTEQAKYVIAASFHGMVFALLYKKPFVLMRPQKDTHETRPASLLKQLGMLNRIVTPETPIDEVIAILNEPYPVDFEERLSVLREQSKQWLEDALHQ